MTVITKSKSTGNKRYFVKSLVFGFKPNCLSEWNKLDSEIRQLPTLGMFKKKLFSLIRPLPQPVYSIHDPKGFAILTQLHVGLSKINLHKFKHNFKDTGNPMCSINDGIEDTEHFLLLCHSYEVQRQDLLDTINPILEPQGLSNLSNKALLKILLYGDERLPLESNTMVLEAAIKYIYATERFD